MTHRDVVSSHKTASGETSTGGIDWSKPPDIDAYLDKENTQYLLEKRTSPQKWIWKLRMMNSAGFVYFSVYSLSSLIVGHFFTLPYLYGYDKDVLRNRKILAVYIFIMLVTNYILIVVRSKRSRFGIFSQMLPSANQAHWTKCPNCDILVPPRAKHCVLCDVCVLKRDHHCFFAGCCIGFHNQRYFIVFCLYGCLGAMYSLYVTYCFLEIHYIPLFSLDFYGYLMPWLLWRWYLGVIHHSVIWLALLLYLSLTTLIACGYFLTWQLVLLCTGQTTYEFLKRNKTFKQPLTENLKSIFGKWSLINFIIPLPWIRNEGDGRKWKTRCSLDEKHF
ncbi:palmitoyltransferase ZDHHC22 isoform X2 [Patella vulgata]|nr:palmitoyltransferase ZDHHC22 isoform X2 [Patella vulgata]XP_050396113.1 palmitoyltransferase ZDHHC22 isoform X2 [Patella vulgata]XP_050396189.1 palmitoyltransferase ZDHHC22 isoform X2 [Patella vulgata]XP_050396268.1 palmitoyltransferase ZDHHC22 isoform X2 [Patella vulgata]XP_050396422.1 palmitoyltransferase ZDHHC22 isoform X2 [Patella vulgata]